MNKYNIIWNRYSYLGKNPCINIALVFYFKFITMLMSLIEFELSGYMYLEFIIKSISFYSHWIVIYFLITTKNEKSILSLAGFE